MSEPNIEEVMALDGKLFAMLSERETEVLNFHRDRGRKFGVSVSIKNEADPKAMASARSKQDADQVLRSANSRVSVTITDRLGKND